MNEIMKRTIERKLERTAENLRKNNIDAYIAEDCADAVKITESLMKENDTISCGGSVTLAESGVLELMKSGEYNFLDRSQASDRESVEDIYRHVLSDHEERKDAVFEELRGILDDSRLHSVPEDLSLTDKNYLEYFSLIYRLSHDIYIRKKLIEHLIDDYRRACPAGEPKKKKK